MYKTLYVLFFFVAGYKRKIPQQLNSRIELLGAFDQAFNNRCYKACFLRSFS